LQACGIGFQLLDLDKLRTKATLGYPPPKRCKAAGKEKAGSVALTSLSRL
jgi:hypothetical protein